MISLQSHNQVLYHLAQATSAINSRSSWSSLFKDKKQNRSQKCTQVDILCPESFIEAAKNCTELKNLTSNVDNLNDKLCTTRDGKNVWIIFSTKQSLQSNKRWKESFVSKSSFDENKRDFTYPKFVESRVSSVIRFSLRQPYSNSPSLCTRILSPYNIQVHGFKTKHNLGAELERNPNFATRIKRWLVRINTNFFDSDVKLNATTDTKEQNGEKLKGLFDSSNTTIEEQKKIKTAFAEGYEVGLQRNTPRSRPFWVKFINNMGFFAIIFVIFSMLGVYKISSGGSIFKFTIGDKVEIDPEDIHVTFNDVKGVDAAKQELEEVVEFLKNPEKFSALGGKLPKGVLLVGPPGTGKTLLARAVAGEAGVPFFQAAGPEFDEILVGQGARRVRELFKSAKDKAPCVIFIDEIDSVGAKRTNSVLHPYANQTINQLLSEMDGFHQNEGVIVLGATNRRNDLDKALLRPGRFDVQVYVHPPDFLGRKEILELYISRILTRDIDINLLAKCTTGFTGADIENMINQAALRAAIEGADYVTMLHLEKARDKVIMGPEGKLRANNEEGNRITAYHEGGHVLVAYYTKDAMPIHKVTILPRSYSLGHTSYIPKDETFTTKTELLANMDALMGGRAAEEIIFGSEKVTTGASSDFERATRIAEQMVKLYGMSEKVGLRWHVESDSQSNHNGNEYSPKTKEVIDTEVKRLLQESYERAKSILQAHAKEHKQIAEALLKYETLDAEDIKAIINGKKSKIEISSGKSTIIDLTPKNIM